MVSGHLAAISADRKRLSPLQYDSTYLWWYRLKLCRAGQLVPIVGQRADQFHSWWEVPSLHAEWARKPKVPRVVSRIEWRDQRGPESYHTSRAEPFTGVEKCNRKNHKLPWPERGAADSTTRHLRWDHLIKQAYQRKQWVPLALTESNRKSCSLATSKKRVSSERLSESIAHLGRPGVDEADWQLIKAFIRFLAAITS